MGTGHGADDVEGALDIGDPVTDRFIGRVFQGLGAGMHGTDLCAKEFHLVDVEGLALNILLTHIDDTIQP